MPDRPSDPERLLRGGIVAAAAGNHARARDLLTRALRQDRSNVRAWLALSAELRTIKGKAYCLEQVLALDPDHRPARKWLAELRGGVPQALARQTGPSATTEGGLLERPEPGLKGAAGEVAQATAARLLPGDEFVLIAGLGLVLLALIALAERAGVEGLSAPLPLLRLFLGLAFVLFVPGYALQAALFPRDDALDGPERLALSFGLSVAVVPPLALILDRLPWGIHLWPIVAGEALVILLCSAVALWRRARLAPAERFRLAVEVDVRGWWEVQDRTTRVLYGILAGALVLALASAGAIMLLPKPGEQFTEFYVLGPEGLAESYPREAAPGEPLSVTVGVHNLEGVEAEYRIEVRLGASGGGSVSTSGSVDEEVVVGGVNPFTLAPGETWEGAVGYALPSAGADQQVDFYLYRDGGAEPYRSLRLWIDIVPEDGS